MYLKRFKKITAFTLIAVIFCSFWAIRAEASIKQPPVYLQSDERWGSELYSITNSSSQTIAASACGPTAMAMVLSYYAKDDSITPSQTAKFSLENNHRTAYDGTSWSFFADMADEYNLDLEFLQTGNADEAFNWMLGKEDPLVVCSMSPGIWTDGGHFILLWKVFDNGETHINDTNSTADYRIINSFTNVCNQCRQYFCFNQVPKPVEPTPESKVVFITLLEPAVTTKPIFNLFDTFDAQATAQAKRWDFLFEFKPLTT